MNCLGGFGSGRLPAYPCLGFMQLLNDGGQGVCEAMPDDTLIHQAKAAGNVDSERGCRTQLIGEVRGDIGNLFQQWDHFSWHRVTVYGDVKEPLIEFAKALGLKIVEEA